MPLWGSIPCADRPVSTLLAETKNNKKRPTKGLRELGYVPAPRKTPPADSGMVPLAHRESDVGDDEWVLDPSVESPNEGCVYVSSPRVLVRPSAAYAWGKEVYFPSKKRDANTVHIVSCASVDGKSSPLTFALVRPPQTSNWVACALTTVANALPHPVYVGISTTADGDPPSSTTIAASESAPVPIPHGGHVGRVWLKVRLTEQSHWSIGGELSLDPSRENTFEVSESE